jgi:tmRNA-binding protein
MEIALAKGKKEFDKRASAKSSDADREAQKAMKMATKTPV